MSPLGRNRRTFFGRAAATTHTLAELGIPESYVKAANFDQLERVRRELAEVARVDPDGPIGPDEITDAVLAQYGRLAACKARVVLASLDDVGAVAERPNIPGTVTQWPNWCLSLPRPVEDILREPLAQELAQVLGARA